MKPGGLLKKVFNIENRGFSLLELMIVVAILGILAAAVGVSINSSRSELKTFVYNTKLHFNMAKFEATKRSRNVYVDFDFLPVATTGDGNIDNGYTVWVDEDGSGTYTAGDVIVGDPVVFKNIATSSKQGPEIYCDACGISGGPAVNDGPGSEGIGDGVTIANDRFRFKPNGMSGPANGAVYLFFPEDNGGKSVSSGPWAIFVNSVGRIRIDEWKPASGWRVDLDD